jgi:hypothetical protein
MRMRAQQGDTATSQALGSSSDGAHRLQDEYCAWVDNLPDNLDGSRLADELKAIAELDLEELRAIGTRGAVSAGTNGERNT